MPLCTRLLSELELWGKQNKAATNPKRVKEQGGKGSSKGGREGCGTAASRSSS